MPHRWSSRPPWLSVGLAADLQTGPHRQPLPLTVRLLCLYPRAWRERYGEELAELLLAEPPSVLAPVHVLLGAIDAHLHPALLPASPRSASDQLRRATLTILCAFVAFLVAALGLVEGVTDLAFAPLLRTDPQLRLPTTVFVVGGLLALAAVLAGGAPILVLAVRQAHRARRHDLWLLAVVPLSLLVLGACDGVEEALRQNQIGLPAALGLALDLVFHALFVLAAVGCTVAVCLVVVRSSPQVRVLRFAPVPAALATLSMVSVMGATVAWFVRAHADAPDRVGQSPLALGFAPLLVLMVASTALAAGGVLRGLAARAAARASLDALEC